MPCSAFSPTRHTANRPPSPSPLSGEGSGLPSPPLPRGEGAGGRGLVFCLPPRPRGAVLFSLSSQGRSQRSGPVFRLPLSPWERGPGGEVHVYH
jgi:hypothetical protein